MRKFKYYSEVGSYRGCIKIGRRWESVKDLNYVDKTGWTRHQGPPTRAMILAMNRIPTIAKDLIEGIEKGW